MPNCYVRGLLLVLTVVALTTAMLASDSRAAMLRTVGEVSVNGTNAEKVSALLPSDFIQTTTAGSAMISFKGTIIRVLPNSAVVYGEVIGLRTGSVEVSTKSGMAVTLEMYRIAPLQKDVKFGVSMNNGCNYVSVQEGTVRVEVGGSKRNTVSAGETLSLGAHNCEAPSAVERGKAASISGRKAVALGGIGVAATVSGLAPGGRSCSPSIRTRKASLPVLA